MENEDLSFEELECYFLEAMYCSLGASLLEKGRQKFDDFIKKLSSLNSVHDEKVLAGPGEVPGKMTQLSVIFLSCLFLNNTNICLLMQFTCQLSMISILMGAKRSGFLGVPWFQNMFITLK